jgi:5-methylcytosine-specific restriction endonuclease McrA
VAWKKNWEREYYLRNREKIIAQNTAWARANRDKVNEWTRKTRAADPEKRRAWEKANYDKDPERYYRKQRAWNEKNPWKVWFYRWKRNERLRGQEYDPETLDWIKNLVDPTCTYCGGMAQTIDHRMPRSKGGTNHRENLTPVCHRCNQRKGSKDADVFIQRLLREKNDG